MAEDNNKAGTVQIARPFWAENTNEQNDTVHPILVYADLVTTGDTRNIEVARKLYDEHITRLIRQG